MENGRGQIKVAIGARLKQAAHEAGMDAEDLGNRLGVSTQTVYNWWRGSRQPDLVDLQHYAEAVGKEEGWFFDPERRRVAAVDDFAVRALWLVMEGQDFGQTYEQLTEGKGGLSPRERRMISAGTDLLRDYISRQADWGSLPVEDRVRLLRRIVEEVHRDGKAE